MGGLAGHYAVHVEPSVPGLHQHAREVAALTAACLLVRTTDFESVGGFSEDLPTDFQDVDFSLKLREKGRVLMYDPTYPLLHVEGATRGRRDVAPETQRTFFGRWERTVLEGDPYYSPHLADAHSDPERGWVHDPNLLKDLPAAEDEARRRVRPRRSR
jgi:GT2 family glycosyltransferase